MKQLILIDHPDNQNTYSTEDYFVSESNASVYKLLVKPASHEKPIILKGAPKSGKTHIGKVWASKHEACIISDLKKEEHLSIYRHCLVDDIDKLSTQEEIEALLHIYNNAVENKKMLLMTTKSLEFSDILPDLSSRLRSSITYSIQPPDDELLRVIARKQFYLHQIKVPEKVIDSLLHRVERSIEAVVDFISLLDREALHKGKPISTRLLEKMSASLRNKK